MQSPEVRKVVVTVVSNQRAILRETNIYLQKLVPGLRRLWSQLLIQDIFQEGLVSGCEDPLLVGKILVTVVSPNICATSATVRTVPG